MSDFGKNILQRRSLLLPESSSREQLRQPEMIGCIANLFVIVIMDSLKKVYYYMPFLLAQTKIQKKNPTKTFWA